MEHGTDVARGLRITTYNCRSVRSSIGVVKQLCKHNDIVLLQEHWLLPDEIGYLSNTDKKFIAFGSSAVDINTNHLSGRPYGGTAILCRQQLAAYVKLVDSKNSRITAVEVNMSVNNVLSTILLASVYMPSVDPGNNFDEDFEFVCGCLNALITDSHVSGYIFAGDFNSRPVSTRLDFIVDCLAPHHAVVADLCLMDANNFTYISDAHSTTSWIDHIIVNRSLLSIITCMSVDYNSVVSDHRPLSFSFDAAIAISSSVTSHVFNTDTAYACNWEACSCG